MDEQEQDQPRRKRAPRPRRFEPARRIRLPIGVGAKIDELAIQGHRSPEDQLRYLIALGLEQATKAE
jgi:hypothetical protein